MKIGRPRVPQLKTNLSRTVPQQYGSGGAQHVGQVRSGHLNLAIKAGGSTPSFAPVMPKHGKKRMY